MSPRVVVVLVPALLAAGLAFAGPVTGSAPVARASSSTLAAKHILHVGQRLVSANGRYHAAVEHTGRLVVRTATGRAVWRTGPAGGNAHLTVGAHGQVVLKSARGRLGWTTNTAGSGRADVLTMRNDGVLALTAGAALVWSSRVGSSCPHRAGKSIVVDISRQLARACAGGQQLRATYVTTGAVAHGAGTPRGTWHVQARIRNTTLHPASGGAYPVHYWMPYNGAYGLHDSPWQKFAYGSGRYRTNGSHGCVHVPGATMAWLFGWARVGTTVTVHA